jgi:hypothetical protein
LMAMQCWIGVGEDAMIWINVQYNIEIQRMVSSTAVNVLNGRWSLVNSLSRCCKMLSSTGVLQWFHVGLSHGYRLLASRPDIRTRSFHTSHLLPILRLLVALYSIIASPCSAKPPNIFATASYRFIPIPILFEHSLMSPSHDLHVEFSRHLGTSQTGARGL